MRQTLGFLVRMGPFCADWRPLSIGLLAVPTNVGALRQVVVDILAVPSASTDNVSRIREINGSVAAGQGSARGF